MKKYIKLISVVVFLLATQNVFSQCKKTLCDKEILEDYDYKSQTSYAFMSSGDTSRVNIVLYSKQDYRIIVCGDKNIGEIKYNIIKPKKESVREISRIDTTEVLPEDEEIDWDNYFDEEETTDEVEETSSNDEPEIIIDTIWERKFKITNEVVFDSNSGDAYWDVANKKSTRYVVEVIIPKGSNAEGCVSVMVGRRSQVSSKFKKY